MFDTMLASPLTECQDDPTHYLSLALNGQVQVSVLVSGIKTKKGKAEVTPYDLDKKIPFTVHLVTGMFDNKVIQHSDIVIV